MSNRRGSPVSSSIARGNTTVAANWAPGRLQETHAESRVSLSTIAAGRSYASCAELPGATETTTRSEALPNRLRPASIA